MYAAQAIPPIDAEIAEKGHLWTETELNLQSNPKSLSAVCFYPLMHHCADLDLDVEFIIISTKIGLA